MTKLVHKTCRRCGKEGASHYASNPSLCCSCTYLYKRGNEIANPEAKRLRSARGNTKARTTSTRALAKRMVLAIRHRAAKAGRDFSLTWEWLRDRLDAGVCEATGLPLVLSAMKGKTPWQPSVDRIDNERGYTEDNCRVVVLMFNLAKLSWDDADVVHMAKALAGRHP